MPSGLALLIGVVLSFALLRIERRAEPSVSGALWIPTVWAMIAGSRPVANWFLRTEWSAIDYEAGSSWDRWTFVGLTALGLWVLRARKDTEWSGVLRRNWGLVAFFVFIGASILWSDLWFVSLKRSVRSASVIVMGLLLVTEAYPMRGFVSIFRRSAYLLLPISLVLIKYFPEYGRDYGRWSGGVSWTGVTQHRNMLGVLCAVSIVVLVAGVLRNWGVDAGPAGKWRTRADLGVLCLAVYLMLGPGGGSYSATSILITVVGLGLLILFQRRTGAAEFVVGHLKLVIVVCVIGYLALGQVATREVSSLLGRSEDLTGRASEIWPMVMGVAAERPILGTGYGNAWGIGGELSRVLNVEQAHNGYLDIYLQLGIVGCLWFFVFIMSVCGVIGDVYGEEPYWSLLATCLFLMILIYNLSETAFFDLYLGVVLVLLPLALAGEGALRRVGVAERPVARGELRGRPRITSRASIGRSGA